MCAISLHATVGAFFASSRAVDPGRAAAPGLGGETPQEMKGNGTNTNGFAGHLGNGGQHAPVLSVITPPLFPLAV